MRSTNAGYDVLETYTNFPFITNWVLSDWTIYVYIKYNIKHVGHQNLVQFYHSVNWRDFTLSCETGEIVLHPAGIILPLNASQTPIDVPDTWIFTVITYTGGQLSTAFGEATPDTVGGVAYVFPGDPTEVKMGYSKQLATYNDLSYSCFGIYAQEYNRSVSIEHAKKCQEFSKKRCPNAPSPDGGHFFISDLSTIANSIVVYSCVEGYWWNSTLTREIELLCDQTDSTMPSLFWNAPDLPAYCTSKFYIEKHPSFKI